ncbi:outer membrane protein [Bordetella trematum]|uniref:outer membrane protein n=1 Tax=Bordetella trematum TaxID=123899 RepID=UPI0015592B18|nr:outer membrane beta-barrel protein [Bordetella trematum]
MQKATCAVLLMLAGAGTVQAGETGSGWYAAARMGYSANVLNDVRGFEEVEGQGQSVRLGDSGTTRRFMGSLALGYTLSPGWRVEAEYVLPSTGRYRKSTTEPRLEDKVVSAQTYTNRAQRLMFNVYRDFSITERFSVYGQLGVGLAMNRASAQLKVLDQRIEMKPLRRNSLAWSVGVGASYALNPALTLDAGYRYTRLGESRTGTSQESHLRARGVSGELYAGLRYAF